MKNWNVYMVYAEDYQDVYKLVVPAPNEKAVKDFMGRSDLDIVKIKVDDDFCIDTDALFIAMRNSGFGHQECDCVTRLLDAVGLSVQCKRRV